jgi:hypothetical protein
MKNLSFIQIVLIVALIILIYVNKNKIVQTARNIIKPGTDTATDTGANATTSNTAGLDYNVRLETGSKGAEVNQLQSWINAAGYMPPLVIDGNFGIKTANAVKFYNNGSPTITLKEAQAIIFSKLTNGLF